MTKKVGVAGYYILKIVYFLEKIITMETNNPFIYFQTLKKIYKIKLNTIMSNFFNDIL